VTDFFIFVIAMILRIFKGPLLFITIFSVSCALHAQKINDFLDQPVFNKLVADDGLSQGRISDIAQDNAGFMWFGTRDGLNRWDGYSMEVYKNDPDNPNSITSNIIDKIVVDPNDNLWILTGNGLCKFNLKTEFFSTIQIPDLNKEIKIFDFAFDKNGRLLLATQSERLFEIDTATSKLTTYNILDSHKENDDIRLIFVDSKNRVWIGKRRGGIQFLDRSTGKSTSFERQINPAFDINQHYITSIVEEKSGNLWLGSGHGGLIYFDIHTIRFKSFNYSETGEYMPGRVVLDMAFQDEENLWIGSDSEGLICFNVNTHSYKQYTEGETENKLLYKTISSLFFDRSGNLWIGTNGKGLNILSPISKKFYSLTKTTLSGLNLSFESIRSIYQDNNHILWVGGYNGMQRIDFENNTSEKVSTHVIYTICPDPLNENILWLGSEGNGLYRFDKGTNQQLRLPNYDEHGDKPYTDKMLQGSRVYDVFPASPNILYIATSRGLNVFDTKTKTFKFFKINVPDPSNLVESGLTYIYVDKQNQLWLGSFTGGLLKMNPNFTIIENFTNSPDKPDLPGNRVNCIYEDSKGRFWVATNMGLCLMNRVDETFVTYNESNGLPNSTIYGILEDKSGNLWLSTNNGISKFNPEEITFKNYNKSDGLPGNEFNSAAFFQNCKSILYFGGVDGLVAINPENVDSDDNPPLMDFTRLKIISQDTIITFHLMSNKEVEVTPDAVLLEIEFSAFSFINPADCRYAYQLGNNTKDWIDLGNKRTITLTKPSPGEYVINMKATNSDGLWNEVPKALIIKVLPRFYQTVWFKFLIITLLLAGLVLIFYLRYIINSKQQKKLQLLIHQRTEELSITNLELNSANASKDKFFSILAHDLKNPFNSLIGFTDLLVTDWEEMKDDEKLSIVTILKRTTENTYELLINLLEWSQMQRKKTVVKPEKFILSEVITDIVSQLSVMSELKNITIKIRVSPGQWIDYDLNMFHVIVRNLVGNAIKFTPKGGKIMVNVHKENEEYVVFQVKDTGIGMDEEKLNQLIKEEMIQSSPGTDGEPGTGLGLLLCREFIKMNGGKYWIESKPGSGSSFFFTIPLKSQQS